MRIINTISVVAAVCALATGGEKAAAQGFGIAVGANFAELGDIQTADREATFDNATGWHAQAWFDLPLGPVALRPGIRYMDAGSLFEDATVEGQAPAADDETFSLIEIPVDVRFRLGLPLISPYLMAGPVLRFPSDSGSDGRFESFNLAGGAGVGVELGLGGLTLYPELKYTFGITRFTKESYQIGGVTVTPDEDQRLNSVMLSVGIGL